MKWDEIRAKILEVVASCVRVDTLWRDREQDAIRLNEGNDSDVVCKLHAYATGDIGRDDIRKTYNSGTNKLDVTQAGTRRFMLQVLCESFDQSDTKFCLNYTERVRSCMQRPVVLAMLRTVGLTCTGVSNSSDVSYVYDQRQVSAANVDLSFTYANNEHSGDGPGLESIDFIETVEGHRTDPNVPAPIDCEISHE